MNTQQQNKKKPEIYCISGFRDTLASPVFYPVIVVSLVLGVTSIFGFVQNPLKLKSMVTVIQKKVAESNVVNDSFEANLDYLVSNKLNISEVKGNPNRKQTIKAFDIFSDIDVNSREKMFVEDGFERIAFNYDVTSESFWTDLDSSKLETAAEEIERKEREATFFGAPLQIDLLENLPSDFSSQDDSIYALNKVNQL